jgi:hypothetical protein
MARLIIEDGVSSGDLFVRGELFMLSSIVLHTNPTHHLDQINNFAPKHRIRFGNLEYVTDTRGNLVFAGFVASSCTPVGLAVPTPELSPNTIYRSALTPQPTSSSDCSTLSGRQEPPSATPVMPAEDPASGLNTEAVFGCQESLSAKPSPHDTPLALSPNNGSMFRSRESSMAELHLINLASSPNTETSFEDEVLP